MSCNSSRIAKALAHFKLLEKTIKIGGAIVECGIFKGASFSRFAMYRKIMNLGNKGLIGFDSFGDFPETNYEDDKILRSNFIEVTGGKSISKEQLLKVLKIKECEQKIELHEGDITKTVPEFVMNNPDLKISLLNLDVDIYEPTVTILEYLFPKISLGGVLILDDYNSFPGETNAVNEYFADKNIKVQEPVFPGTPHYIVKEE